MISFIAATFEVRSGLKSF